MEFARIRDRALAALTGLDARVEHVGSTSIPGCAAKPVIDLDVLVPSAVDVTAAVARLEAIGYIHRGTLGLPGREAFLWPEGEARHHLYVLVVGSPVHVAHMRFRDHLRRHPAEIEAYSQLKRELAATHGSDREGYTEGKSEFVERVLADAGR